MGRPSIAGILHSKFGGGFLNLMNFLEKKCLKLKVVFCHKDVGDKNCFFLKLPESCIFLNFCLCFYSKTRLKVEIPRKCTKVQVRH